MINVLVSLAQLVWTMHNICKVRGSNPGHHKKIKVINLFGLDFSLLTRGVNIMGTWSFGPSPHGKGVWKFRRLKSLHSCKPTNKKIKRPQAPKFLETFFFTWKKTFFYHKKTFFYGNKKKIYRKIKTFFFYLKKTFFLPQKKLFFYWKMKTFFYRKNTFFYQKKNFFFPK